MRVDRRSVGSVVGMRVQRSIRAVFSHLRGFADRRARRRILVLGDSHVRVFEHWLFLLAMPRTRFDIVYVRGGTATGIANQRSKTQAGQRFEEALARGPWDLVLVDLGEVDAAFTLWSLARKRGQPIETLTDRAITNYVAFLDGVRRAHDLIVIAATLPTLADLDGIDDEDLKQRARVPVDQRRRTDLTLEFNRRIAAWCAEHGVPHLDSTPDALGPNGLVDPRWTVRHRPDHHYARRPFARWLIRALRPHLAKRKGPTVG